MSFTKTFKQRKRDCDLESVQISRGELQVSESDLKSKLTIASADYPGELRKLLGLGPHDFRFFGFINHATRPAPSRTLSHFSTLSSMRASAAVGKCLDSPVRSSNSSSNPGLWPTSIAGGQTLIPGQPSAARVRPMNSRQHPAAASSSESSGRSLARPLFPDDSAGDQSRLSTHSSSLIWRVATTGVSSYLWRLFRETGAVTLVQSTGQTQMAPVV